MIRVVLGDLAAQEVEAVVRPVRSDLAPATAASRDLGHRAGDALAARLDRMGPLPLGSAVLTPAGELPCSFLIHVAVMSVDEPQTPTSVRNAIRNALRRAADWDVASLALPPLGLGVGAMEPESAAAALLDVLRDHLAEGRAPRELSIVVGSEYELQLFTPLLDRSA